MYLTTTCRPLNTGWGIKKAAPHYLIAVLLTAVSWNIFKPLSPFFSPYWKDPKASGTASVAPFFTKTVNYFSRNFLHSHRDFDGYENTCSSTYSVPSSAFELIAAMAQGSQLTHSVHQWRLDFLIQSRNLETSKKPASQKLSISSKVNN